MNDHYAAFTLAEVTIAMVIASIVISASLYALQTLTQTSHRWETFQRENLRVSEAQQVMERDFSLARSVFVIDSQVVMHLDSGVLIYTLYPCLIRQSGAVADTLLPAIPGWQYSHLSSTALVDTLIFDFEYQGNNLPCTLIKHYPFADIARYQDGNTD